MGVMHTGHVTHLDLDHAALLDDEAAGDVQQDLRLLADLNAAGWK